jgi:hypothetical protein
MRKLKSILFQVAIFTLLVAVMASCEDFFETNIEDKTVDVVSPTDNFVSQLQGITFWWNPLKGATSYQIQIVSPSFDNIQRINLDSTITSTKFLYVLAPGAYQWRVKALNSAYSTAYTTLNLTVEYNSDLSAQELVLKTPTDSLFTNSLNINFSWFALAAADSYIFEVRTSSGQSVVSPFETIETSLVFPTDFGISNVNDGFYKWSVYASNWFSVTPPSLRTFAIDRVNPGTPVLLLPTNTDTLSVGNVNFTWQRPLASIAPVFDTLRVETKSGSIIHNDRVNGTSKVISLTLGDYKWKVRSFDRAGNSSQFSTVQTLRIE